MTILLSQLNFRDLGGLPFDGGGAVRSGMLFRSEGPASFSDAHREELGHLNVQLVCDLRSRRERTAAPNDWIAPERCHPVELLQDIRARASSDISLAEKIDTVESARTWIKKNYASMPGSLLPHLSWLLETLSSGSVPALVHCTAGKDRTGVFVALLLEALGVERDAIMTDYMASLAYRDRLGPLEALVPHFVEAMGFHPTLEVVDVMVGVEPEFLQSAFDAVVEGWGSFDNYFDAAGVTSEVREHARSKLTTAGE